VVRVDRLEYELNIEESGAVRKVIGKSMSAEGRIRYDGHELRPGEWIVAVAHHETGKWGTVENHLDDAMNDKDKSHRTLVLCVMREGTFFDMALDIAGPLWAFSFGDFYWGFTVDEQVSVHGVPLLAKMAREQGPEYIGSVLKDWNSRSDYQVEDGDFIIDAKILPDGKWLGISTWVEKNPLRWEYTSTFRVISRSMFDVRHNKSLDGDSWSLPQEDSLPQQPHTSTQRDQLTFEVK